jgi:outer membrane protein TolC
MDDVALKQLERDLESRKLDAVEADVAQDRANKADALTQKGAFFESDAAWQKSRQTLQIKLIELEERTGVDDVAGVQDVDRAIGPLDELTAEDCLATAQTTRVALISSREAVRLADLGVKYANLKRLPSVYFYTGSDFALTQEVGTEDFELRAGVTVSYPLYGAGDTAAAIADAKAAAVRARIQDSQTHMKVEREIREAYWGYVNAVRQLESTREREQVFEEDFKEAQVLRDRGAASELEFMQARIRYQQSRQRVRQLELDALMARATLTRAVGVSTIEQIQRDSLSHEAGEPGRKEAQ